ncbi:MAG: ArsA-related P-loop ATPase [Actinomycetota bacterium]|nr:ArsA-related P-loop ATPase [Actinomycetota bacterium]
MSPLLELLDSKRVVLCLGAGGVGKTTAAAALAVAAASHGRDVGVLTVDPARRLAQTLGLDGRQFGLTQVELPGGTGRLSAEMLDPAAAWDQLVRSSLEPDSADRLIDNSMYHAVTRRFIQSHDFIAIERLHHLLDADFDLVIVDTPPSARAFDFLEAPRRMEAFFSMRALGWFTGTAAGPLGELTARPFRAIADRVLGARFLADLIEFFALARSLSDGLTERSEQVMTQLRGPVTANIVVTTPEPLPIAQAAGLGSALLERGLSWDAVLANRVLPGGPPDALDVGEVVNELTGAVVTHGPGGPGTEEIRAFIEGAADAWGAAGDESMRQRRVVADRFAQGPMVVFVEERPVGPKDLPALLELAGDLDGDLTR